MASRDDTGLLPKRTIAITILKEGQCRASNTCSANLAPAGSRTKPPKIDLAAEAEPRRASAESSEGAGSLPATRAHALASAAKPDEELARPAAVGKELVLRVSKCREVRRDDRRPSKNRA
jgi:hypothetical protein